eukprot:CAMPEP_0204541374 /NCGR_PEP_ID=MMETSP0661-20131031/18180_1 /ASSEMBLY_ACC=CAM_ASM_000606 /TAXON_ID=109239 /ORGANISM="Alexandrium margalefi, Strain AMGDE01CS-322" /LENGTH=52 /DNA_ID=CAMNT_0051548059 /DNA_START=11 /DNA_END=165 /DNA_ORIENTATION=+
MASALATASAVPVILTTQGVAALVDVDLGPAGLLDVVDLPPPGADQAAGAVG